MDKIERKLRRKKGIRKNIYGTKEKPRISVFKSNRHLFVQAVDDDRGITLCSMSDSAAKVKRNCEGAEQVGVKLAEDLVKHKIATAVFDRNGNRYQGIVKAVAEGIRKGGVKV